MMVLKMAATVGRVITITTLKSHPISLLNHHQAKPNNHHTFLRFPHSSFHLLILNKNNNMSTSSSTVPPPDNPSSSPPIKTVKVMIKGRVQGVFYRDWTVQNANELGLKGWVRNRRDGSVEALFSGAADKVGEMQERCRRGPPSAMVTGLNVNPSTEDPGTGFERRSTA
uniref:acylphosphatase n=1 Tax=Erigeron canadensis TaxID=72917 RepID=UPI001CB94FE8|nr:acylphosphatase [Erigeron canadensis]